MKKYTRKRKIKGGFEPPKKPKKNVKFASYTETSDDESHKQLFPEIVDRSRSLMRNPIQPRDRHDYAQFDEKDFFPPQLPERGRRPDRNSSPPDRGPHEYGRFKKEDFASPSPPPKNGGYKRKTIRKRRNVKK